MPNSRIEKRYIPPKAQELGAEHVFVYTGGSMLPTFQPGQLLYVSPAANDLAPGDVVVYYDQATGGHVVHRVVAAAEGGLVTRGDNNPACDTRPVAYGQVVGRVSSAEIGGRYKEVAGGQGGLWAARRRWAGRALWVHLAKWLGKPYRWLKRSIWVRRALRALIRPHFEVIRLQTPQGALVKVLHRGKVVGRTAPGGEQLVWRQPYDLWVEASDLPVLVNESRSRDE